MGSVNPEDDLAVIHAILDKQGIKSDPSAARRLIEFIDSVNHMINDLTDKAIEGMDNIARAPRLINDELISEGVRSYKLSDGSIQQTLPGFDQKA